HGRGRTGDRGQHSRFVGSGDLLASEDLAGRAVHRVERNNVRRTQWSDGSREVSLNSKALADLLRQLRRDPLVLGLSQVLQIVVQFGIADKLNERRLLKLDGQRLLQSRIEYWVAGLVGEVGEN